MPPAPGRQARRHPAPNLELLERLGRQKDSTTYRQHDQHGDGSASGKGRAILGWWRAEWSSSSSPIRAGARSVVTSSQMARTPLSTSRTSKRLVTARWTPAMSSTSTTRQLGRTASTSGQPEPGVWSQAPAPVLRRTGTRVVIAPVGTPDTPMTQRRHRLADGLTPDSSTPTRPADQVVASTSTLSSQRQALLN